VRWLWLRLFQERCAETPSGYDGGTTTTLFWRATCISIFSCVLDKSSLRSLNIMDHWFGMYCFILIFCCHCYCCLPLITISAFAVMFPPLNCYLLLALCSSSIFVSLMVLIASHSFFCCYFPSPFPYLYVPVCMARIFFTY